MIKMSICTLISVLYLHEYELIIKNVKSAFSIIGKYNDILRKHDLKLNKKKMSIKKQILADFQR